MTKTLLTALGLLALTGTAQAADRSYQVADCTVSMMMKDGSWKRIGNTCYMGRDGDNTAVKMGRAVILIQRDPKVYGLARIYTVDRNGDMSEGEPARASGPCWVGITLTFCAP
jgi:hypothetical protein